MGWDAYSSVENDWTKKGIITDKKLRRAFKKAVTICMEKCNGVDGYLLNGGLDCSSCRNMLQKATGQSCYEAWNTEKVRQMQRDADWDFKFKKDDAWAYWSAKLFLLTCFENNLSIRFSG